MNPKRNQPKEGISEKAANSVNPADESEKRKEGPTKSASAQGSFAKRRLRRGRTMGGGVWIKISARQKTGK